MQSKPRAQAQREAAIGGGSAADQTDDPAADTRARAVAENSEARANAKPAEQHKRQIATLRPRQRGQPWANPRCGDRTCAGVLPANLPEIFREVPRAGAQSFEQPA